MKQRFEQSFEIGTQAVRGVVGERGEQYRDTLENAQWLTLIGALEEISGIRISNDSARLVAMAAMVDVKYWRQLGPWKHDTLVDRVAYEGVLLGEMERLDSKLRTQAQYVPDPAGHCCPQTEA